MGKTRYVGALWAGPYFPLGPMVNWKKNTHTTWISSPQTHSIPLVFFLPTWLPFSLLKDFLISCHSCTTSFHTIVLIPGLISILFMQPQNFLKFWAILKCFKDSSHKSQRNNILLFEIFHCLLVSSSWELGEPVVNLLFLKKSTKN